MFQTLGVPILGIVENMSYMPLPGGGIADIFGRGGAQKAAQELNLPFLGDLPLYPQLRVNSDAGDPHQNFTTNPDLKRSLESIVQNLAAQISIRNMQSPTPELTIT
jgi:ATP-binding protein involved in chromosome partitioning